MHIFNLQTDANKAERPAFGQTTSHCIEAHPDFLNFTFFSNKANFHVNGHTNKQNQPQAHDHHCHPLSEEKVTVWCTLGRNGITLSGQLVRGC